MMKKGKKSSYNIEGINFTSQDQVCKYFGVPYATVRARMARNKMTFEEAVMARRGKPPQNAWDLVGCAPVWTLDPHEDEAGTLGELAGIFKRRKEKVQILRYDEASVSALRFFDNLAFADEKRAVFCFATSSFGMMDSLQFVIPELVRIAPGDSSGIFAEINAIHQDYTGGTLILDGDIVRASTLLALPNPIPVRVLMQNYEQFMSFSSAAYERLRPGKGVGGGAP